MMSKSVALWAVKAILYQLAWIALCVAAWWLTAYGEELGEEFGIGNVDTARRGVGILIGIYLIVIGNRIPKGRLVPPSSENSAILQQFQRCLGWETVLTGVVFVLAWLVLPMGVAYLVSIGSALLIFAAAMFLLWRRLRQLKAEQPAI